MVERWDTHFHDQQRSCSRGPVSAAMCAFGLYIDVGVYASTGIHRCVIHTVSLGDRLPVYEFVDTPPCSTCRSPCPDLAAVILWIGCRKHAQGAAER